MIFVAEIFKADVIGIVLPDLRFDHCKDTVRNALSQFGKISGVFQSELFKMLVAAPLECVI